MFDVSRGTERRGSKIWRETWKDRGRRESRGQREKERGRERERERERKREIERERERQTETERQREGWMCTIRSWFLVWTVSTLN